MTKYCKEIEELNGAKFHNGTYRTLSKRLIDQRNMSQP